MQDEMFDTATITGTGPKRKLKDIRTGKVDFRLALTPQIGTTNKIGNGFANAVARLEKAKARLRYYTELSHYSDRVAAELIHPAEKAHAESIEKEIRLLDAWYDHCPHKLTKKRKERLREVIIAKLEYAINDLGREDLESVLARHQTPLTDEEWAQRKQSAQDFIEGLLGVKLPRPDENGGPNSEPATGSDAGFGSGRESAAEHPFASSRPKTKRQLENEAEQKKAQELLDRDLNRVFKDLVVKLHPDLEQNEERRQEKEELMKLLTRARDDNDYSELLRLHVLVNDSQGGTNRQLVSESTLKTLTKLLNQKTDQVLRDVDNLQRQDSLMAGIIGCSEQGAGDRAQIRRAAEQQAGWVRDLSARCQAELEAVTHDARAFYQYLQPRRQPRRSPGALLAALLDDEEYF